MITVFTPAYNRAYRLPALYESLKFAFAKIEATEKHSA